jgi:hypothetical protein
MENHDLGDDYGDRVVLHDINCQRSKQGIWSRCRL